MIFICICLIRWLNDLLSLGAKRPLQAEDLYGLLDREKTDALTDCLERYFRVTIENPSDNRRDVFKYLNGNVPLTVLSVASFGTFN